MEDDIFLEVFGGFGEVEGFALLCSFSSSNVRILFFIFFRTLCFVERCGKLFPVLLVWETHFLGICFLGEWFFLLKFVNG